MTGTSARRIAAIIAAIIAGAVLLTVGLAGCSDDSDQAAAVCMDPDTHVRLDDDRCDQNSDSGAGWMWAYFLLSSQNRVGAVGQPLTGYSTRPPSGASAFTRGGLPRQGGPLNKLKVREGVTVRDSSGKKAGTVPKGGAGAGKGYAGFKGGSGGGGGFKGGSGSGFKGGGGSVGGRR